MRRPNLELVHALAALAFGKKTEPGYAAASAMTLGAVVSGLPDQTVVSSTTSSLVASAAAATASSSEPAGIRIGWLEALGNTGAPSALPTILASLETDPDELVRAAAARALRFQDPQAAQPSMDKALLRDHSIHVRYELMHSARLMGPEAMQPLVERTLTADKSESVRLAAAYAIAVWMVSSPGLATVLQNALATEKSLKVRDSLMNYLTPGRVVPPTTITPVTVTP
jgi:HEAT repeat protein